MTGEKPTQKSDERPPLPQRERDANGGRPDPIGDASRNLGKRSS